MDKIETNEIDGWIEKDEEEEKKRRTRGEDKEGRKSSRRVRSSAVWRSRKTSPSPLLSRCFVVVERNAISPPFARECVNHGRGEANWRGEGRGDERTVPRGS